MIKRIEIGISGKRMELNSLHFIRDIATQLEFKGEIFVKSDGSVRIIAEGEEESLKEFAGKVEQAGVFSELENFYANWSNPTGDLGNFYIVND
jgi:acylphosphatase